MSKEEGGHSFSPTLLASVKAGSEGLTESDEMGVDKGVSILWVINALKE